MTLGREEKITDKGMFFQQTLFIILGILRKIRIIMLEISLVGSETQTGIEGRDMNIPKK